MKNRVLFIGNGTNASEKIYEYEYKISHRTDGRHFTRKSTMDFCNTMFLTLNFMKKTRAVEVNKFLENVIKVKPVTDKAYEKARDKIEYTAFSELFEDTSKSALSTTDAELYKGRRLAAIDGSTLLLPNSAELKEYFGETTPEEGKIFARISSVVDVLNKFIIAADIGSYHVGEQIMAIKQMAYLGDLSKYIFLADRGYWNPELIAKICVLGGKFVFRIKSNACLKITNSKKNSGYYLMEYGGESYRLRYYKFTLKSGETEILVTNLGTKTATNKELEELYHLRWGIESKYHELKALLQLENVSGKSVRFVKQDFYATMWLSNMIAFAKMAADETIQSERAHKDNKHQYQLNKNATAGIFKDDLIKCVIEWNPLKQSVMFNNLLQRISAFATPVSRPRSDKQRNSNYRKPHYHINRKSGL